MFRSTARGRQGRCLGSREHWQRRITSLARRKHAPYSFDTTILSIGKKVWGLSYRLHLSNIYGSLTNAIASNFHPAVDHSEVVSKRHSNLGASERLSDGCAGDKGNEAAPPHSMTSSARARNAGGTVRPIAFAVFMLMISSNFVGCWTGRSAGLAPLRILST